MSDSSRAVRQFERFIFKRLPEATNEIPEGYHLRGYDKPISTEECEVIETIIYHHDTKKTEVKKYNSKN